MRRTGLALVLAVLLGADAGAMPKAATPGTASEAFLKADALARAGSFREAVPALLAVIRREPDNADAHTWLGFSYRKLGDLDRSERHYRSALDIEPDNLSALEYYGELFLMRREPDKARELLARLARLCPMGCEERTTLEQSIASFRP